MPKEEKGRAIPAPKISAAPGSPTSGEVYYDTTQNKLFYYNGTSWVDMSGGAGGATTFLSVAKWEID